MYNNQYFSKKLRSVLSFLCYFLSEIASHYFAALGNLHSNFSNQVMVNTLKCYGKVISIFQMKLNRSFLFPAIFFWSNFTIFQNQKKVIQTSHFYTSQCTHCHSGTPQMHPSSHPVWSWKTPLMEPNVMKLVYELWMEY